MYATDFFYDEEKLSDYRMMICSFNGSGGIDTVSSGADIAFNQIKPSGGNQFNLYSSTFNSAYSTTFQICKNPQMIHSQNELHLTTKEVSAIQRWLCRKDRYYRFKIIQEDYGDYYWSATFSCKQIILNGFIVGLELTLFTDAPYAYKDELSLEYDCVAEKSFDLYDISDAIGHINPPMTIKVYSGGNFRLTNSMDNKITVIQNCLPNETITIDGKNQLISTSSEIHKISQDFNYFFPKIINTYENNLNTFTPSLDCKLKINYSPIVLIGL